MDPNATLDMLLAAIADGDFETAREHDENLSNWLGRGGFLPRELESISDHIRGCFADILHDDACRDDENGVYLEFRIYIRPCGRLAINTGDASFDQDHREYCGAGSVGLADCDDELTADDFRTAVLNCFNDAIEMAFQSA